MSDAGSRLVWIKARHRHTCIWCGQRIERDETYARWAWFADGTACTNRAHRECVEPMNEACRLGDGFEPHTGKRGESAYIDE